MNLSVIQQISALLFMKHPVTKRNVQSKDRFTRRKLESGNKIYKLSLINRLV